MSPLDRKLNDPLTERVIGLAMKVHSILGPGFLESVYRKALLVELGKAGIAAEEERPVRVLYDGVIVGDFKADILISGSVLLELKAVEVLLRIHEVQTVNYLNATGIEIGLLLNFGGDRLQMKRKFRHRLPKGMGQNGQDAEDRTAEAAADLGKS